MKKVIFINPGQRRSSVIIKDDEGANLIKEWKRLAHASMVIVIDMETHETQIIKNRWGKIGTIK